MMVKTKNIPVINKFSMVLLLLAPILGIYGNPNGWSLGMILSIPLSVLFFLIFFLRNKSVLGRNNPLPKGLLTYFVYWLLFLTIQSFNLPIIVIQSYLLFFLMFATFDYDYFFIIYKPFALFCIVFFIIQEIGFLLTGNRVSGIIQSLPLYDAMTSSDLVEFQSNANRSCSIFREPAHLAQFLLPILAVELYYDKKKLHYVTAALIGGVLLLLQSGNGFIGMAAILVFVIPFFFNKKKGNKWISVFLFLGIISLAGYYYVNSEMGMAVLSRQSELSSDFEGGSASGFLRIWRGLYVYADYSLFEKLFGCPDGVAQLAHVRASGMLMVDSAELYFNAFQKVLLNTGILGLGIFAYVIVHLWKDNSICGKAILAAFIGLSFVSAIFMSNTMILYLVLANSLKEKNRINYIKNI